MMLKQAIFVHIIKVLNVIITSQRYAIELTLQFAEVFIVRPSQ